MAFASGGSWSVVAWNESQSPASFALSLPRPAEAIGATTTNAAKNLQPASLPLRTTTGTWRIDLAPTTIATYTFGPLAT
jgi:hypothetical protein